MKCAIYAHKMTLTLVLYSYVEILIDTVCRVENEYAPGMRQFLLL